MDPETEAPMVASVVLFITVGAVILFRPITKRLGSYLEVLAEERRQPVAPPAAPDARVLDALESIERRMARLEERQAFTDALLASRKPGELPSRSESDHVDRA